MDLLQLSYDSLVLVSLGLVGYFIFNLLRFPIPGLLGAMIVIGAMRIFEVPLPTSPDFLAPFVQIIMGSYLGAMITKERIDQLKEMALPSIIIASWTLGVAFVFGYILSKITYFDLSTAILSSSMGGLPEMTVLALGTNAKVEIVVVMLVLRMVSTVILFPLIIKYIISSQQNDGSKLKLNELNKLHILHNKHTESTTASLTKAKTIDNNTNNTTEENTTATMLIKRFLLTLIIAAVGGIALYKLDVPAGAMVGAMVSVAAFSLSGIKVMSISANFFRFMLIGIGIVVADNITLETVKSITEGNLIFIGITFTGIVLLTSILIALLIKKVSGWDIATCLLAAAPAGFTVMTALAIDYGKDPFSVSGMHLCRLITLKTIIPLTFIFLI